MLAVVGCGGATDDLDRRAVSGNVTLDGAPLPSGMISFDPAGGTADAVPVGAVISNGSYSIPAATGPVPGNYKVSIRSSTATDEPPADEMPGEAPAPKKGAKDPIPAKYNTNSELTAEVPASGSAPINFDLQSK